MTAYTRLTTWLTSTTTLLGQQCRRLLREDTGAETVQVAALIGIFLALIATLMGPQLYELLHSLIAKWTTQ